MSNVKYIIPLRAMPMPISSTKSKKPSENAYGETLAQVRLAVGRGVLNYHREHTYVKAGAQMRIGNCIRAVLLWTF
jgi:hypothetical protein